MSWMGHHSSCTHVPLHMFALVALITWPWSACRIYNFYALGTSGCWCSNNGGDNIINGYGIQASARVGYSECLRHPVVVQDHTAVPVPVARPAPPSSPRGRLLTSACHRVCLREPTQVQQVMPTCWARTCTCSRWAALATFIQPPTSQAVATKEPTTFTCGPQPAPLTCGPQPAPLPWLESNHALNCVEPTPATSISQGQSAPVLACGALPAPPRWCGQRPHHPWI